MTQEAPQLTVTDLQDIKSIIEVASKRGTFAAAELTAVGTVYDKLTKFLVSITPKQEETVAETPQTEE